MRLSGKIDEIKVMFIENVQAKISEDEILGVRAPGLTPGFNAQYEVPIKPILFYFIFKCLLNVKMLSMR